MLLLFRVHCLAYTTFLIASFASNPVTRVFFRDLQESDPHGKLMGKGVPTLGVRGETPDVMALFC